MAFSFMVPCFQGTSCVHFCKFLLMSSLRCAYIAQVGVKCLNVHMLYGLVQFFVDMNIAPFFNHKALNFIFLCSSYLLSDLKIM